MIPELLSAGIPEIASLNLLAPAIRVDEFKQRIMKKSVFDKIKKECYPQIGLTEQTTKLFDLMSSTMARERSLVAVCMKWLKPKTT